MAVIVEVPDASTMRLARRLIGRRSGVSVVVTGTDAATRANSSTVSEPEPDRRVVVGLPYSSNGNGNERHLTLLQQGIWAVIPATDESLNQHLRRCVDDLRTGLCPLLTELVRDQAEVADLVEELQRPRSHTTGSVERIDNPLSERETEILQFISQGFTSREIASEMGFQLQTVKNQVAVINAKTHARSRTHAVSIAQSHGWIKAP